MIPSGMAALLLLALLASAGGGSRMAASRSLRRRWVGRISSVSSSLPLVLPPLRTKKATAAKAKGVLEGSGRRGWWGSSSGVEQEPLRRRVRQRRQRAFAQTQPVETLKEGDYVEVHGMKRMKEWEGRRGRVVGQEADSPRLLVKFPGEDAALAISPARLRKSQTDSKPEGFFRVGEQARIVGMKRLKQYEGKVGTVLEPQDGSGRVRLQIEGEAEPLMISSAVLEKVEPASQEASEELVLPPGTVKLEDEVYLVGIAHDDPNSVESARQIVKAVRPENIMVELCWERVPLLMDPPMPPDMNTYFVSPDVQFQFLPEGKHPTLTPEELLKGLQVKPNEVFSSRMVFDDARRLAMSKQFLRVIPIFSPPSPGVMPLYLPSDPAREQFATQVNPVGTLTWRLETAAVPNEGLKQTVYGLHTYVFRDIAHKVLQQNAEIVGLELPPALADRPPLPDDPMNDDLPPEGELPTDEPKSAAATEKPALDEQAQEAVLASSDELADAVVDPWMQMQKLAQQRAGVTPGEAYRTAMSEALRMGAKAVILGDQPQYITRTRIGEYTSSLSEEEAIQPVVDQIAIATMDVEKKQEMMKEYIEGITSEEADVSDPDWEHPVLKERDEHMTMVLWNSAMGLKDDEEEDIVVPTFQGEGGVYQFQFYPTSALASEGSIQKTVAIVGANHIPGIRKLWKLRKLITQSEKKS